MTPEIVQYLNMIDDLRNQVENLIKNLPAEALNWRPLPDDDDHATNSLAVLAAHIAGAEHFWIAEVIGENPATRDRPSEFLIQVDSPASLLARLNEVGTETSIIFRDLNESDLNASREVRGRTVSLRWAVLHVIEHTALHLGHMQITYQLWKHGEIGPSPRWYERLP